MRLSLLFIWCSIVGLDQTWLLFPQLIRIGICLLVSIGGVSGCGVRCHHQNGATYHVLILLVMSGIAFDQVLRLLEYYDLLVILNMERLLIL